MEFRLHRAFPEDLENEWNDLLSTSSAHVPFLRYEYLANWWDTRGGGEWPEEAQLSIITAHREDQLTGIAPLFHSSWEGQPSLLLLGSIEISDYLDLIARPENMPEFTSRLLAYLAGQNSLPAWKRLDFYNVLENSISLDALSRAAREQEWDFQLEPFRPSLTIPLPGDWDTYLAGIDKKQRHEIRRKIRRAYTSEKNVRWYFVEEEESLGDEIDAFIRLMEQDPEKAAFLTPLMRENFRNAMRTAYQAGFLHLSFMEINGQKAASYFCFDYLNQIWVYNSGMDLAYNEYSPGWVLLGQLIQWANENGRTAFDFMRGDEDYKIRFGAQKRDVMRATITRS